MPPGLVGLSGFGTYPRTDLTLRSARIPTSVLRVGPALKDMAIPASPYNAKPSASNAKAYGCAPFLGVKHDVHSQ